MMNDINKVNDLFKSRGIKALAVDFNIGLRTKKIYIKLDLGEKYSKIKSLSQDLKLHLQSSTTPDIYIDGEKGIVVIEITINTNPIRVEMKDIVDELNLNDFTIPIILGRDMAGAPSVIELASCPHLLIGGTTGSGKSILLKSIIKGIVEKENSPEINFVMVDPKGCELAEFRELSQTAAYCTTYEETIHILEQAIQLMEDRYELMSHYNVLDLSKLREIHSKSSGALDPYVVIIIDELTDLILQDKAKVFVKLLTRLTGKARAAGIHIIAATQNPKREIINGLIKANMPTTIALKTSSSIESKIIINSTGAEKLIGFGDMLLNYKGKTIRVQGAISDNMTSLPKKYIESL